MTLLKIVQELDTFDKESTIYAAKPWTENSKAMVLIEPESGGLPNEVENKGLKYFLEVFIAQDFVNEWVASLDTKPTPHQICLRLIQYATNDA